MPSSRLLVFLIVLVSGTSAQVSEPDCRASIPIPFYENGRAGYLTTSGVVIPARYDLASDFFKGIAIACVPGGGCGPIDLSGRFIGPLQTRDALVASRYSEGLGVVVSVSSQDPLDQQYGYVELSGKIVIPLDYDWAGDFDHGMALVRQDHKMFFIDRTGKKITPEFEFARLFSEDVAPVEVQKQWGYIRRDGSIAIAPQFAGAEGFSEGLAAVVIGGRFGYIDLNGKVVVQPLYNTALQFSQGLAAVEVDNRWGYIDRTGKLVTPIQFRIAHTFREGLASVQLDSGKWGYIDQSGKFEIQPVFDLAMPFCSGIAAVETFRVIGPSRRAFTRGDLVQGKRGMIDRSGKYVWRDGEDQVWDWP